MANGQQRIDEVLNTGQDLIDSGHFASDVIEEWCDKLTESWENLLETCNDRRNMLGDSAESQRVSSPRIDFVFSSEHFTVFFTYSTMQNFLTYFFLFSISPKRTKLIRG